MKLTRKPVAENCANCKKLKSCNMYVLQDGSTEFVCYNCRYGISRVRASKMSKAEYKHKQLIKEYNAARDKALLEGPDATLLFMKERKLPTPSSKASFLATYHKTVTGVVSLPLEFRKKSKQWLDLHHLRSLDDGDLK